MLNRMYLIGSVWEKPKVIHSSDGYAIMFLVAVFAKNYKCGQPPHRIGKWQNVVAGGELGRCCVQNLQDGYLVYVDGRLRAISDVVGKEGCAATVVSPHYVRADSVMILSDFIRDVSGEG